MANLHSHCKTSHKSAKSTIFESVTKCRYSYTGWTVNSPEGLVISDNTFSMPKETVEVTATWEPIPYAIKVNDGGTDHSATPNPATFGQTVTLHWGTRPGFGFVSWELITPKGLEITNNSFSMPAEAVEVTVVWREGKLAFRSDDEQ